jgi:DNA-binding MarR family transcriptional regulator
MPKQDSLTTAYTRAHEAIADMATAHGIRPMEMRILMFIVDTDGENCNGVESVRIGDEIGITGSNVRRALYDLHATDMIEYVRKQRGQRLVVAPSKRGQMVGRACARSWAQSA